MPLLAIALILLVASYLIGALLMPKVRQKPAALEDWEWPQADDGTPEPVVFGDVWTEGPMILWYGNYRTTKIKSGGGKK